MNCIPLAADLAELLAERKVRIVLAESCTAGLASAVLAMTPGVSAWHCGSAVTYREQTKQDWLGVTAEDLQNFTAVSAPVARQMSLGVLEQTAEADWSASITGHLGPHAPEGFDGLVFIGLARRTPEGIVTLEPTRHLLETSDRAARQDEAAGLLLLALREAIRGKM